MARTPITAAAMASTIRMPPSSTVLSSAPNAEMAKFLTPEGARSIAAWPTATAGAPCRAPSPETSCPTPMATAAVSTPAITPSHIRRRRAGPGPLPPDMSAPLWPATGPGRRCFHRAHSAIQWAAARSMDRSALELHGTSLVIVEYPACGRAGEVGVTHAEDPERPHTEGGVDGGIKEAHLDVRGVLGVHQVDDAGIRRLLRGHHAAGVGQQVLCLAGRHRTGEPERAVVPHAPDRHDVRPAVRPGARHPVVPGEGEPLGSPRPFEEPAALVRPGDAVPRHVGPACARELHGGMSTMCPVRWFGLSRRPAGLVITAVAERCSRATALAGGANVGAVKASPEAQLRLLELA